MILVGFGVFWSTATAIKSESSKAAEFDSDLSLTSSKNENQRHTLPIFADNSSSREPEDKEIELVMSQASCSRQDAIDALKSHGNDIVEVIMFCTNAAEVSKF